MSLNFFQNSKSKIFSGVLALFFVWIMFVFIEFFIQCPEPWLTFHFSAPQPIHFSKFLTSLSEYLSVLLICFWLIALTRWIGQKLLRVLGALPATGNMTLCLEMGLGIFFWNLFWLGLGLTRLWFAPVWVGVLVLLTLWVIPDLFQAVRRFREVQKPDVPLWFWAIVLVYGLIAVVHAVLPETFYDSLNYFLGLPQFWIFQHGISDNSQHLLSGYFYGGSTFFMAGWLSTNTGGATLFSVVAWALCGLLAYGWAEELAGKKAAFVAAAAVLTFPLLYLNAWAVRVDDLFTFVSLLFIYCISQFLNGQPGQKRREWIILAALFAGLAVSIKPTALVVVAALFLVLLVRREKGLKGEWSFLLVCFTFFGLFLVGPWLLKNWVFAGNSFFPYASSWLGGRSLSAHGYHRLLVENRQFLSMDRGFWSVLDLPWRLTMPDDGDDQMIGPLIVAFLPGFLLFKLKAPIRFLVWIMFTAFVLGLCLSHMLRFSMPAFVLAMILFSAVFMAEEAPPLFRWSWKISVWFFAVFFLGAYAVISAQFYKGWDRWTGLESDEVYLSRLISNSYEPLVLWMDKNLPMDARLLIVGDSRGLYYTRTFYANSVFDEPFLVKAAKNEKDAAGILRELRELGITHVVINGLTGLRLSADYGQYEMTPSEWAKINDLLARGLKPVYWENFQAVYEVKDKLSAEKRPYLLNLFSFLPPTVYDFSEAIQAGNKPKARQAVNQMLTLFPQESYWRKQLQELR